MPNPNRKFKREFTITVEGYSRGADDDLTFIEDVLTKMFDSIAKSIGVISQQVAITVTSKSVDEKL